MTNLYDGDGNLTLAVNAVGDSTSYQYDADGNQTLVVSGYNSTVAATVRDNHDAEGNQIQESDLTGTQLVGTSSYAYNSQALVTSIQHNDCGIARLM